MEIARGKQRERFAQSAQISCSPGHPDVLFMLLVLCRTGLVTASGYSVYTSRTTFAGAGVETGTHRQLQTPQKDYREGPVPGRGLVCAGGSQR